MFCEKCDIRIPKTRGLRSGCGFYDDACDIDMAAMEEVASQYVSADAPKLNLDGQIIFESNR